MNQTIFSILGNVLVDTTNVFPFSYILPAGSNGYAIVVLFSVVPWAAVCHSACDNIGRENIKWCIQIADEGRSIETCISLNDFQEVYESTCDAQALDLQAHLSLPDVRQRNVFIFMHVLSVFFLTVRWMQSTTR